jgi:hypothetical protein
VRRRNRLEAGSAPRRPPEPYRPTRQPRSANDVRKRPDQLFLAQLRRRRWWPIPVAILVARWVYRHGQQVVSHGYTTAAFGGAAVAAAVGIVAVVMVTAPDRTPGHAAPRTVNALPPSLRPSTPVTTVPEPTVPAVPVSSVHPGTGTAGTSGAAQATGKPAVGGVLPASASLPGAGVHPRLGPVSVTVTVPPVTLRVSVPPLPPATVPATPPPAAVSPATVPATPPPATVPPATVPATPPPATVPPATVPATTVPGGPAAGRCHAADDHESRSGAIHEHSARCPSPAGGPDATAIRGPGGTP